MFRNRGHFGRGSGRGIGPRKKMYRCITSEFSVWLTGYLACSQKYLCFCVSCRLGREIVLVLCP